MTAVTGSSNVERAAPRILALDEGDNVAVAIDALAAGVAIGGITARTDIPPGHKVALHDIPAGDPILKYGQIIGFASQAIARGEHVHSHNVELRTFARSSGEADAWHPKHPADAHFMGYRRSDGRVGTRNQIGVLTTVNCSGTVARAIVEEVRRSEMLAAWPEIDGIGAFVHHSGCGMASSGLGFETLSRTIAGYAVHPNFGGILIVGLGCEVMQLGRLVHDHGLAGAAHVRTLDIQSSGGTRATIAAGVAAIGELLPIAGAARRDQVPAAELTLALQCGGSDAYSGMTANPALGAASDLLVAAGGRVILTETTEIYGAEHLLMARAADPKVADRLAELIAWWERHTCEQGETIDNNPSPGNKAGGLTTILEKSLGAVAKAGRSPLEAVIAYAERAEARGLNFMDAPGFDPVSATGQIASGATVLCFTTGRGSAFGSKPTPSIKLSTTSDLYRRMPEDIDIDCGDILDGVSVEEKGRQIFELILRVASGARTVSEELGYGDAEFVPWRLGTTV